MAVPITQWMGTTPRQLREEIRNDRGRNMQLRRGVAAVSLLGIATMAATTLLQLGAVKRLPDPPIGNFDSRKVNTSDEAFSYGAPGSPVNILAHAVNLLLASTGSPDRARKFPWLPILAAAVEAPQTVVTAKPFPPDAESGQGMVSVLHRRYADALRDLRAVVAGSTRSLQQLEEASTKRDLIQTQTADLHHADLAYRARLVFAWRCLHQCWIDPWRHLFARLSPEDVGGATCSLRHAGGC